MVQRIYLRLPLFDSYYMALMVSIATKIIITNQASLWRWATNDDGCKQPWLLLFSLSIILSPRSCNYDWYRIAGKYLSTNGRLWPENSFIYYRETIIILWIIRRGLLSGKKMSWFRLLLLVFLLQQSMYCSNMRSLNNLLSIKSSYWLIPS